MSAAPAPKQVLFSSDTVRGLLERGRLLGSKPLPKKDDPVYNSLAMALRQLKHLNDNMRDAALEREQQREKIGHAIWILTELLPTTREDYEIDLTMAEQCQEFDTGYGEWARRNLVAFDALVRAAAEARSCGLPIADISRLAPKIKGASDLIGQLETLLARVLPDLGVGERHRFIASAVQLITGKPLTAEKVRDRLRKMPLVNTGN